MNAAENIQRSRQAEFEKLLNSIDADTPLLLFPLRIETHFRPGRPVIIQKDHIYIPKALKRLIDAKLEGKPPRSFLPLMADVRRTVETAEFVPDSALKAFATLNSQVFSVLACADSRYPAFELAIQQALASLAADEKIRDEIRGLPRTTRANTPSWPNSSPAELSRTLERLMQGEQSDTHVPAPPKELCVRIFPDEIFLDTLTENLTEREKSDGKFFWLQWFIASGSKKREYEAWQVLCTKYPAHRAAWIARQTKPTQPHIREFFKTTGALFYRRPYQKMAEIEEACDDIYRELSHISMDDTDLTGPTTQGVPEREMERKVRENLGRVKEKLFEIDCAVMFCEYIVDYLFDEIHSTVEYLSRRMDAFIALYEKYPGVYGDNNRPMELWDVDQTMLMTFRKEVDEFLRKLSRQKRIPLDTLVQKYLDDKWHDIFPNVRVNASNTPDMPVSNILPDRFMFIGEIKGREKEPKLIRYGHRIKPNLQMGIHPSEDMDEEPYKLNADSELEVNGGIAWMVDYDKAEKAGMAITVPLQGPVAFNYVYVLGVKDGKGQERALLHNLFNGHNYTSSGLEMLKPGTPTNLVEGGKKGLNWEPEEEMRRRYEIEVEEASLREPNANYDSRRLSNILNLDYDTCWGHAAKFDNRTLSHAEKANKVLWTHFRKTLSINVITTYNVLAFNNFLSFVDSFFVQNVKARGVLPSFRIGNQPYGILPVTEFPKFSAHIPQNMQYKQLTQFLVSLANQWKELRDSKVLSSTLLKGANAAEQYLEMAGLTPYSTTFYERTLIDSPLLHKRSDVSTAHYGLPPGTLWGGNVWQVHSKSVHVPSYFAPLNNCRFFNPLPVAGTEKEVGFSEEKSAALGAFGLSELAKLVRAALPEEEVSDEECQLLTCEFVDLFTHRLDAWFSGVLSWLLRSQRKTPKIGAYGWVFNLEESVRTPARGFRHVDIMQKMKVRPRNAADTLGIYESEKGEYIVAPSIQHAISAAILRAAYVNTKGHAGDSHMCINLSSMRARQALRMVSGIQAGMSTGIILGADLERHLHEAYRTGNEMSQYIYPLRKLFPQEVDLQAEDKRARAHVMHVINGEALLNTFLETWYYSEPVAPWLENFRNRLPWYKELDRATRIDRNIAHRACLFKLIARLVDSYDALNDLLLAEGVHRLVQGDRASFSAISQFMAEGKGTLPEPSILDTPMEYVVVSNKVAIALPACTTPPARPMCLAEPSVNAWLEQLMGSLQKIYFYVEREEEAEEGAGEARCTRCTLEELGLRPIEYLYLCANDNVFLSYLEARWRLHNNCWTDKLTLHLCKPDCCGEVQEGADDEAESEADSFSLYENELRISRLRSLVLQSSAMQANDWTHLANSDAEEERATDMEALKSRYVSLRACLSQLHAEMHAALKGLEEEAVCDDATLAKLHALLCRCVEAGLTNSLPQHNAGMFVFCKDADTEEEKYHIHPIFQRPAFDKARGLQQAFIQAFAYVQQQLEERIVEAEKIVAVESDEACSVASYVQAIQKLLLDNFKVFPPFTLHHALTPEKRREYGEVLNKGIARYANLSNLSFEAWQSELAQVREGMKRWHHVAMFQNMCGGSTGKVSILQTTSEGDTSLNKWLGCQVETEAELQDVDSLLVYNSEAFSNLASTDEKKAWHAGIVIDAWPEFIPYKKQTAGIAFHVDQPDNEAPQALLLAVHPEFSAAGKKWDIESVRELLDSTRFMLMNRAVEPDHIYQDPKLSPLFPLFSPIPSP